MINDDDGFDEWLDRVNAAVREITGDMGLGDFCGPAIQRGMFLDGLDVDTAIDELCEVDSGFAAMRREYDHQTGVDNDAAYAHDGDDR